MKRRNRSNFTVENYRRCLLDLEKFLGNKELEQVKLSQLREWIDVGVNKNLSPHTIWTKVVITRAFFNWCVHEELLPTSPSQRLSKPKLPQRLPKALNEQETLTLLRAAQESRYSERDVALVYFFLETGARRGAVASLLMMNLHLEDGTATTITKGDKEIRLFFGPTTKEATRKWLDIRDPRKFRPSVDPQCVFGLTSDGIRQVFSRLAEHSGIQNTISPHILRHTSATLRVEQGIDSSSLQQIMGWADIRMAEVYTSLAHDRLKRRALETSPVNKILNYQQMHSH